MKAITLRNLPPNLDKAIRKRARAKRMSVNKAVIGLLEEHLTQDKTKRADLHHDLDDLSGSWFRRYRRGVRRGASEATDD